jgi:hypothetical protein
MFRLNPDLIVCHSGMRLPGGELPTKRDFHRGSEAPPH